MISWILLLNNNFTKGDEWNPLTIYEFRILKFFCQLFKQLTFEDKLSKFRSHTYIID
jgi:hypothetical protein